MLEPIELDIPCPNCGKATQQSITREQREIDYTCGGCGRRIIADTSDVLESLLECDAEVARLADTIDQTNKEQERG